MTIDKLKRYELINGDMEEEQYGSWCRHRDFEREMEYDTAKEHAYKAGWFYGIENEKIEECKFLGLYPYDQELRCCFDQGCDESRFAVKMFECLKRHGDDSKYDPYSRGEHGVFLQEPTHVWGNKLLEVIKNLENELKIANEKQEF